MLYPVLIFSRNHFHYLPQTLCTNIERSVKIKILAVYSFPLVLAMKRKLSTQ